MGEALGLLPHASSWMLGEDAALLEAMQGLATSFSSSSKQLHDRMDRLAREAASAHTRLLTTQNNFVQLSNVKFIEARVYEDSEEAAAEQNVQQGSESRETPSEESQISEALECGVKLLEAAFEKVEIEDSDSDEESSKIISVMQPKNSFHIRSLPAVIGSKAWFEDDKIGLVEEEADEAEDEPSESSDEEVSDQRFDKEDSEYSQSDGESSPSAPQSSPSSGPPLSKEDARDQSDSEFSDDDDELFKPKSVPPVTEESPQKIEADRNEGSIKDHDEDSSKESDGEDEEASQSNNAFSHELSKKFALSLSQPRKVTTKENAEEQSRPNSPPKLAQPKKSLLFDSSDSEDDLFSGKPSLPKKAAKPKSSTVREKVAPPLPPAASKPNNTGIEQMPPRSPSTPKTLTVPKKDIPAKKSLFMSSSEDDVDDIFANIAVKATEPVKPRIADEQNDSDDDIFSPRVRDEFATAENSDKEPSPSVRKPFGGISIFGAGFNPTSVLKTEQNHSHFKAGCTDEEEDEDDIFSTAVKAPVVESQLPPGESRVDEMSHAGVKIVDGENSLNIDDKELGRKETSHEVYSRVDDERTKESSQVLKVMEVDSFVPKKDVVDSGVNPLISGIETPVLTTLTKSRSRGTAGRRPPSRSARKKAVGAAAASTDEIDEADEGRAVSETEEKDDKKPIGGISMFGARFSPAAALKSMKSRTEDQNKVPESEVKQEKKAQNMQNEKPNETNNTAEPSENVKQVQEIDNDDDIISDANEENGQPYKAFFGDDNTIFAAPSEPQPSNFSADRTSGSNMVGDRGHSETLQLQAPSHFDDESAIKLSDSNNEIKAKKDIFGFDEDGSDDDLFSNMASGVKPSLKPNPLANILGDDSDDDLFSSLIPKSTK